MYCWNCGHKLNDGAKFCPKCGTPVNEMVLEFDDKTEENDRSVCSQTDAPIETVSVNKEKKEEGSKQKKKKHRKGRIFVILFLLILCVVAFLLHYLDPNIRKKFSEYVPDFENWFDDLFEDKSYELEVDEENLVYYSNGDVVYLPEESNLALNEEFFYAYYDNLLIVFTISDLCENEAEDLADEVGGIVVGDMSGAINLLQILVSSSDYETLNEYAETLMQSENVLYAQCEVPVIISDSSIEDNNPWTEEKNQNGDIIVIEDKGNEDASSGNDWWAEAIGAYTAWEYIDSLADSVSNITVGILDSGFYLEHEDLSGKITMINDNSEDDHGTHVAGIIASENNDVGIRGVADSADLICADWTDKIDDESGETTTQNLTFTEMMELTKQMVEEGAKIINNSWCTSLPSETETLRDILFGLIGDIDTMPQYAHSFNDLYDSYDSCEVGIQSSVNVILAMMCELYLNGYQDVLFVQSAGNGYDNSGPGYDINYGYWYCGITEDRFNSWISWHVPLIAEKLEDSGFDYEWVNDHIIIVGAVDNAGDDGVYYLSSFSNYGSGVDIVAPGGTIYSTLCEQEDGSVYGLMSGTSMAAPMVSGAAALIWAIDPTLTAAEVKAILTDQNNTGTAVGVTDEDAGGEYPMLNVGLAVAAITASDCIVTNDNNSTDTNSSDDDGDGVGSSISSQVDIPEEALEWNGHYYYVFEETCSTWEEAKEYCESMGGYLAVISSEEENTMLYEYIVECGYNTAYFGYTDSFEEGLWEWIYNEGSDYTNWGGREPNSENSNEDYAEFYYKYSDGGWNDGDFRDKTVNDKAVFICEWNLD